MSRHTVGWISLLLSVAGASTAEGLPGVATGRLGGTSSGSDAGKGVLALAPGDPCIVDAECNDCDLCTFDMCSAAACTGGPRDGFPCDSDNDCEGICAGGDPDGEHCFSFLDCCSEVGSPEPHGDCSFYSCDDISGGATVCVNWSIPDRCTDDDGHAVGKVCASPAECTEGTGLCLPGFQLDAECDDGLECNGYETCNANACIAGDPLCTAPTPRCSETTNSCLAPCTAHADCDYDGLACTNDVCCLTSGGCGDVAEGECYVDAPPCGPGGSCVEGPPLTCNVGRCCDASGNCSSETYADCPGTWLVTNRPCGTAYTGRFDVCPAYGSGIAPQGDFVVEAGNITHDTTCPTYTFESLGDDYEVDAAIVDTSSGFVDVHIVRVMANVQTATRFAVEFWDVSAPLSPLLIEDRYFPQQVNASAVGANMHEFVFSPPLTVPVSGVVAVSEAPHFTPYGAFLWLSTDAVDVGTNNPDTLFINGEVVTSGALGMCSGGDRNGQSCDARNGNADCPNGACSDVPDVLVFEMVVDEADDPTGACCVSADGTCSEMLRWECEAQGNLFQGAGTRCDFCDGNPFVSCDVDTDCSACDGGVRENEKCGNAACPGGSCVTGTCSGGDNDGNACDCPGAGCVAVGPCIEVSPACSLHACCEYTTGDCAVGFCDQDPAKPCNDYDSSTDCGSGETCVLVDPLGGYDCPSGWWCGLGYGIDCDPNCCEQPMSTGYDNCMYATPLMLSVPAPGQAPLTVTTTGYNSGATFDDFTEFVCDGGGNDGNTCDPDFDCPDGECVDDFCVGGENDGNPCDPDVECPGGGTCDRICGLEMFNPDAPGGVGDPGWWEAFYIDAAANVRIDLCCTDPVHEPQWAFLMSECAPCGGMVTPAAVDPPVGTGDSPYGQGSPFCDGSNLWQTYGPLPKGTYYHAIYSAPNGHIGEYQLHVTAQAAPLAACCSTLCVGGDRDGEPCNGMLTCLNGTCNGGVCINGDLDGFECNPVTGEVTQCPNGTCGNTIGCDETNELICDAFDGFWMAGDNLPYTEPPTEPAVSCGASPCATGSCCTGPGECEDEWLGAPMTEADCEGDYVGGAKCDWDPLQGGPCPVCPAAPYPGYCQAQTAVTAFEIDRINGPSRAVADDFVTLEPGIIGEFCFHPCFHIPEAFGGGECADPYGTVAPPPDDFEIRFYEDDNGLPGEELPGSPGPVSITAKGWQGPGSRCWDYCVDFYSDIWTEPFQTYWVEISAAGSPPPPAGTGCTVSLGGSLEGNGYSLRELGQSGSAKWTMADLNRVREDGESYDFAFCIESGLDPCGPTPMVGACCECDGTCTDGVPWEDCLGYHDIDSQTGAATWTGAYLGTFTPERSCWQVTCEDLGGVGGDCQDAPSGIPGEDCVSPRVIIEGATELSNLCSPSDRPTMYETCDTGRNVSVGADLWFEYHVPAADRTIRIDVCDTDFDAVLAVYTNGTATCPPPSECDSQGGPGNMAQYLIGGLCRDNECATGGPTASVYAGVSDQCFLIRVAGRMVPATQKISVGSGTLDVSFDCYPASTPQPERLDLQFDPISQKIRYLSFSAGNPGQSEAIRITFVDLPAPYDHWNGTQLWVQPPEKFCENAGVVEVPQPSNPPDYGCPFSGNIDPPWFWGAELGCDPYWTEWTQYDLVHVWNEGIIPAGTYDIQVIEETCSLDIEGDYSPPLTLVQSVWADLVQDCEPPPPCKPPDGITSVSLDLTAILEKWKNTPGNVKKVRADIEGSPAGDHRLPDQAINITDVTYVLGAFQGYTYDPPPGFPAPSPAPVCP